tara:strand:+ start:320 stop:493 length:174 start_codon:yes stop_codon:yes gene_type:complete
MSKIPDTRTHLSKGQRVSSGRWLLVRVRIQAGIEGVGECFVPDPEADSAAAALQVVE